MKNELNEAERFLLQRWNTVNQLLDAAGSVETKYEQAWQSAVEQFVTDNPVFDYQRVRVSQRSGNNPGRICIANNGWPAEGAKWFTGIWIENIRLDYVAEEETDPPIVSIWFEPWADAKIGDSTAAANQLLDVLRSEFSPERMSRIYDRRLSDPWIEFELCSKTELFEWIGGKGDASFSERLLEELELLGKLGPTMKSIFSAKASPK